MHLAIYEYRRVYDCNIIHGSIDVCLPKCFIWSNAALKKRASHLLSNSESSIMLVNLMSVLYKLYRRKDEHKNKMHCNDLKMLPKMSDLMTMFWPFITLHNPDLSKQRAETLCMLMCTQCSLQCLISNIKCILASVTCFNSLERVK